MTMENIQADEETRPLAQPQRRVAEAYAESNVGASILKKSSFWILVFVAFLVFSAAEGEDVSAVKKKKREMKLRNKAEFSPAEVVQKQSEINRKIDLHEKYEQLEVSAPGAYGAEKFNDNEAVPSSYDDEDSEGSEEDLDEEIDTVLADVDEAEEEEIEINDSMLVSAVRNIEDNVKLYFGRVFGDTEDASSDFIDDLNESEDETSADIQLSDEQLDLIAKKIADRLEADVKKDFRDKADVIAEEKVEEIDQVINEDRKSDMDANKIKEDVAEAEKVVVEDLRDEIDKAAVKVKQSLPDKVERIRNEVMEEETGRNMDYIERKKRQRREKMMKRAERLYDERLQKRKEFDEANGKRMDGEKSKYNNEGSSGGKYYRASKKVMPITSSDEFESRQQKKPSDYKKKKYSNSNDASEKYYQTKKKKKQMPLSSDDEQPSRQKVHKKEQYVREEKEYYEDESSD
mmetsp:Transcript_26017/g.44209  ORF Transcript_26017/g.44209 Transcript_26017/m.44209 type:complete len:460 (-) Transcript_26017:1314-2693(-)